MSPIEIKQARPPTPWRGLGAALAGAVWLALGLSADAQVSVDTIGGGVRVECGPSYGFIGGNTYDTAQFHGPSSCALDTNGNLWIADKTNNALEQVTQAGNKADSVTIQYLTNVLVYTTNGTTHKVTTNYQAYTNVTGVAVDPANNLYVLLPSPPEVKKYALTALSTPPLILLSDLVLTNTAGKTVPSASAMTVDANSNVFVSFTNGVVIRYSLLDSNHAPTNVYTINYTNGPGVQYIVASGSQWQPASLALRSDGQLAVSDTLSNAIYIVSTNSSSTNGPQLLTGANGTGYAVGDSSQAQFDQPRGLAAASDGSLIVCDMMNNRLLAIDANSNTTWLYGTASNVWTGTCCSCDPTLYAGWVDGTAGLASNNASGRLPISVAISPSGSLFVTELYYNLIRQVANTAYVPVNLNGSNALAVTLPATGISATNATLNGTVAGGDETTSYYFAYGATTNYGMISATNVLSNNVASSQPVSITIANLIPSTTYYYQLVAFNGLGSNNGVSLSFPTSPEAPVVTTQPAINITFGSATLQASVNPEYAQTTVTFQWGTTTNLGNTTTPISLTANLTAYQTVTSTITNLQAGTTYYYQAVASSSGGTTFGSQLVFDTPVGGADTLPATNITATNALLQATVNPEGFPAAVYFQWGTTSNYGNFTTPTNLTANLSNAHPISATISNLQAGTTYYFEVVVSNFGGALDGNTENFTTTPIPPPTLSFSPSNGYFPECVTISVTSSVPEIYYTTDGSTPTTNSTEVLLTNSLGLGANVGSFQWCNPLLNLSALRLLAINGIDTNSATLAQGGFSASNLIGFPQPLSAGPGGHLYIPVVVDLQSNLTLQSLQFRVEITPNEIKAPMIASMVLQPLTPNDLVPLPGPAPGDAAVAFDTFAYTTSSNGQGLVITATGNGSGLNMQGSGVVVMLHLQIPATAAYGASYSLNVLDPSGTSDGQQSAVSLASLAMQTLTITDPAYMVGDSSPSSGYNAGQFGNGALDNSDVNNAIYASVGIRVPPSDSDLYNAMDAWPPDSAGRGGDGFIRLLDWETILARSLGGVPIYLGLDTNNYIRFWTNGDNGFPSHAVVDWSPGGAPVALALASPALDASPTKLAVTNSPPGLVWFCEASIGSGTIIDAVPGITYALPVYANVGPGYSLAALQFRATVTGSSGAPAVTSIQFNPASGVPTPLALPGLAGNDKVYAWGFGSFAVPLENSNYLGTVSFQIPSGVSPEACYALHFSGVDGAPGDTLYQLESFPGYVWVMSAAQQPASIISDEWKIAFFGSLTNTQAEDNADPDGDGSPNWQEYLAGTNPTNALSRLQFTSANLDTSGVRGVAINWLTAPGKTYILQSSPSLTGANWTPINTNTGDGNEYECIVTNVSGNSHFYQIRLQP